MAMAISALNAASLLGFDRAQANDSRQQSRQTRSDVDQQSDRARRPDARDRIIPGEVVSRETETRDVESAQRALQKRQAQITQADSRQISQRAAVETYQQNQVLVTARGETRQVSGIIDEFV